MDRARYSHGQKLLKNVIAYPIKNYIFGADIIENIFDFCNEEDTDEGLTLKKKSRDFETIDENEDGLVLKQESCKAYDLILVRYRILKKEVIGILKS